MTLTLASLLAMTLTEALGSPNVRYPLVVDGKTADQLCLRKVAPEYPLAAKLNYIQGHVWLEVLVSPKGQVKWAHVISGHPLLAASALKAVRHWVYRPLVRRHGATAFWARVDMKFELYARNPGMLPFHPEQDLERQIQPPLVVKRPVSLGATSSVRMRVLLGANGKPLDSSLLGGPASELESARRSLTNWAFRPARWGSLPVPWYVDVNVPVAAPRPTQASLRSGAR